jgi:hypothetical protein
MKREVEFTDSFLIFNLGPDVTQSIGFSNVKETTVNGGIDGSTYSS